MALTFSQTQGDGVTVSYPILVAAGYAEDNDIIVELINTATGLVTVQAQRTQYTTKDGSIQFISAPTSEYYVRVRRFVSNDNTYSDFETGNSFVGKNLHRSLLHGLYQIQQLADGFREDDFYWKANTDAGGRKLTNLAPGIDGKDAATLGQLRASSNAFDLYNTPWAGF